MTRTRLPPPSPLSVARQVVHALRAALQHIRVRTLPRRWLSPIECYRRDGWDRLITEDFNLGAGATVLDFGGYVGNWSAKIQELYGCCVHIFEPVPQFTLELARRFKDDPRVQIHPFAVGISARHEVFNVAKDETGLFALGSRQPVCFVAAKHLEKILPPVVDLAAINIEGGEYELIEALDGADWLRNIERIVVQFHPVPSRAEAERRRKELRLRLAQTHELIWSYDFVWEYWEKKSWLSSVGGN